MAILHLASRSSCTVCAAWQDQYSNARVPSGLCTGDPARASTGSSFPCLKKTDASVQVDSVGHLVKDLELQIEKLQKQNADCIAANLKVWANA